MIQYDESTIINDQYIIQQFFNNGKLNGNYSTETYLKNYKNIYEYLITRYDDSETLRETFIRIYQNIEHRPKCPFCDKIVTFRGKKNHLFNDTCGSNECQYELRKHSLKSHYNVENTFQLENTKNSIKSTKLEKYGNEHYNNPNKIRDTWNTIYSNDVQKNDIIKKRTNTNILRYGSKTPAESIVVLNKMKNTCIERYGVDNYRKSDECIQKIFLTKKQNKTVSSSKIEKNVGKWLKDIYGENDVFSQYTDSRYVNPINNHKYHCDYYIKSLDLFIEVQGFWKHGPHPYNEDVEEDIKLVQQWENKHYYDAITCWTIGDVRKRSVAKINNLKYLEIFGFSYDKEYLQQKINEYLNEHTI